MFINLCATKQNLAHKWRISGAPISYQYHKYDMCENEYDMGAWCWVRYWRQCAERVSSKDNGGNSNDKVTNSKDKEASK